MSETFLPGLFVEKPAPQELSRIRWPLLSPGPEGSNFYPGFKELEEQVLKELREKVLRIEKEAYEKGFEQGEKDGRELGVKRLETVIQQLRGLLAEIEREKQGIFQTVEKEMLRLMLEIGRRLFRRAALIQETTILEVLKEAFQYVTEHSEIVLRLNPMDYHYLKAYSGDLPFASEEEAGLRILQDPGITRGGCLLETSFGTIDATIESQIDALISALLEPKTVSSEEKRS